jgi:hypothetical protein
VIRGQTVPRTAGLYGFLDAYRYDPGDEEGACDVLLVGEDNPQSSAPEDALYPYPIGCAGHNFAENIADVGMARHLATWRTNLCNPAWSAKAAAERARQLVVADGVPWRTIVMLGVKVARAFGSGLKMYNGLSYVFEPFTSGRVLHRVRENSSPAKADLDWITLVSLPHPSGRCRVWNDAGQVHRARALLAEVSPWYAACST